MRSWRRSDRQRSPRTGDLVIDTVVDARLLGLRILTVDARVVVTQVRESDSTRIQATALTDGRRSRDGGGAGRALSRAAQLLEEGTAALDEARMIH